MKIEYELILNQHSIHTGLCNENRISFVEMSSWAALTRHLEMKTALQTKYIISKYVPIWSKMLSSSLYAMLKLSKRSSPQKLFDYD